MLRLNLPFWFHGIDRPLITVYCHHPILTHTPNSHILPFTHSNISSLTVFPHSKEREAIIIKTALR